MRLLKSLPLCDVTTRCHVVISRLIELIQFVLSNQPITSRSPFQPVFTFSFNLAGHFRVRPFRAHYY